MPFTIIMVLVGLGLFIWLLIPNAETRKQQNEVLDPNDSRSIGLLIGMFGGSIEDAAIARFALQRFEETHGRPACVLDAAIVVGIMSSGGEVQL